MSQLSLPDPTQIWENDTGVTIPDMLPGRCLLQQLLESGVLLREEWAALDRDTRQALSESLPTDVLVHALLEAKLLTEYQASCVRIGAWQHLALGNYRILDRIGAGGMGVVYRGEHMLLRRPVAIKVVEVPADKDPIILKRFLVEMRTLARIRHPNIVHALDAGTIKPSCIGSNQLHYLVMEYVTGPTLEKLVAAKGPMSIVEACNLIYQVAGALEETNQYGLIHRDITPANILVTGTGMAKVLDFGLALHFGRHRLTVPGTLLGTLSYMAPEQVVDAANVDIRADIFSLGATLYYCLAGKPPFSREGSLSQQVASRLAQASLQLRAHRPDLPVDLEAIVRRMMAHDRGDRYPTPKAVMRALLCYAKPQGESESKAWTTAKASALAGEIASPQGQAPQILIVDDEPLVRGMCASFLRRERFDCHLADDGSEGLRLASQRAIDLVLLDIDMPKLNGTETLRHLRENPPCDNLKVIMMSGGYTSDDMSELLALGADDYVTKPLARHQLIARIKTALLHKAAQDRSALLNQNLLQVNAELEQALVARNSDLVNARNGLVFALAKIVESRFLETSGHLIRMTKYAGILAREARSAPRLATVLDDAFIATLEACTILHDIGNVAMPDHILQRVGALDPEDEIIVRSHTTIGAETLQSVARRDRGAAAFWEMAIGIARHHHERFDGMGYPDRLAGDDIPLAARIVALADAYDTIRSPGSRPGSHQAVVEVILAGSLGRFDPLLLEAFARCAPSFDRVFLEHPEEELRS